MKNTIRNSNNVQIAIIAFVVFVSSVLADTVLRARTIDFIFCIFLGITLTAGLMNFFSIDLFSQTSKEKNAKNKDINIRIYKVIFPNGQSAYEIKSCDSRGGGGFSNLKSLAKNIGSECENLESFNQLTIDFNPFHKIEYPGGLVPRKCIPLTGGEIEEFWKYLNEEE